MQDKTIAISFEEYTRLKDIETRFTIIKEQMLHAEYCPIHTQIILGIEKDFKETKYIFDEKTGCISKIKEYEQENKNERNQT